MQWMSAYDKRKVIFMKSTKNRHLSLLLAIVLLITMTACAKSSTEEESSQVGSSSQIEETRSAEDTAAEQGQLADNTAGEQGQLTDNTAAEQEQPADNTAAEQGQPADETTAEQAQPTEDVMKLLQQADEAAQEEYDKLDLSDKASVIEMIQALMQVDSAIHRASYQQIATRDADGKILYLDQEIRRVSVDDGNPTSISYMKGRKGLVISHYGGDNYTFFFVCDGTLIGKESGHSTGRLDFSGCLPDWKDHPAGETHSIIDGREITDDYHGRDYDGEMEYVGKYLKEAGEILEGKE
jgi:hypothetical protein